MRYWWVNQNQTFKHEFDGAGWRVDVAYAPLDHPLRPKDHIADIRPLLPPKYAPLQDNGDGLQSVYLAELPGPLATLLLERLRAGGNEVPPAGHTPAAGEEEARAAVIARAEADQEREVLAAADLPETERQQLVMARRGQGRFRAAIAERVCRVSGVANESYLVASHIKPWRAGDNRERLDGANGLLLAPHVDFLFDRGLISFADAGDVLVSPAADEAALAALRVLPAAAAARPFEGQQRVYLSYHRRNVFLRAGSER